MCASGILRRRFGGAASHPLTSSFRHCSSQSLPSQIKTTQDRWFVTPSITQVVKKERFQYQNWLPEFPFSISTPFYFTKHWLDLRCVDGFCAGVSGRGLQCGRAAVTPSNGAWCSSSNSFYERNVPKLKSNCIYFANSEDDSDSSF